MMNPNTTDFNRGVVAPVECLKEGWALIKDQYWLFLGISVVGMLIGSAFAIVLKPVEFGDLFKGFDYFVQGLVAAAIQTVPIFIVLVPAFAMFFAFTIASMPHDRYARDQGPPPGFIIGVILFVLVMMVISLAIHILFVFAYPLIVDRKLSGWDAIRLSARASMKNFGGMLGLILLNFLLGILGVFACYVGVFFVMPISFASYAAAYRRIFPDIAPSIMSPPPPPASWA
ncbi:MAG: hypothetical protein DMF70_09420 [Acidobacteria bacterium]|nr:MAG: hypothetical protein DMF70_09420 [Acidobacteriota bacterium]